MMSPVCYSRSLFLAVLCCFSAVFRALFFAVILALRSSKARVSAAERGLTAVFFQHYQRDQRTAASSTTRVVVLFLPVYRIWTPGISITCS
jgi:hypothetical protein